MLRKPLLSEHAILPTASFTFSRTHSLPCHCLENQLSSSCSVIFPLPLPPSSPCSTLMISSSVGSAKRRFTGLTISGFSCSSFSAFWWKYIRRTWSKEISCKDLGSHCGGRFSTKAAWTPSLKSFCARTFWTSWNSSRKQSVNVLTFPCFNCSNVT